MHIPSLGPGQQCIDRTSFWPCLVSQALAPRLMRELMVTGSGGFTMALAISKARGGF